MYNPDRLMSVRKKEREREKESGEGGEVGGRVSADGQRWEKTIARWERPSASSRRGRRGKKEGCRIWGGMSVENKVD